MPDLQSAVAGADGDVTVLPLLLSAAFHAQVDVPAAVASLDREVRLLEPLGHPAALLDALLVRSGVTTVVVAAGTREDDERAAFEAAVGAASRRTGVTAFAAFATGPGARLEDSGTVSAVVPWLLAPGRLLDQVEVAAGDAGLPVLGGGLLLEPELLDHLAATLSP
jgi:sirohydrochlorin ferrochelatase